MKKNLFLVAMAAVAFAACSDDFADAPPVVTPIDEEAFEKPIVFNSSSSNITRANYTGATAAEMLGGKFVVTGYKGSQTKWNDANNKIVFDNFIVEWGENTANTTESNTNNWEYVGKGPIKHAIDNGITRQAIKYWDYTQLQYDFIAWSTGKKEAIYEGTPTEGKVLVSEIDPAKALEGHPSAAEGGVAYTFTGAAADLSQCYIADLVTVKKDGTETGAYGQPVVLTFRSLGTKVRIGLYETIPGYSVKNVKFYSAAASNDAAEDAAKLFTTTADNIYTSGTYTVFYKTVDKSSNKAQTAFDEDNNQAHIKFTSSGDQTTIADWTKLNYSIAEDAEKTKGAVFLGRSSNTATFAGEPADNYYKFYLPNETGTNLNLRVDYTLEAIDGTGEEILVRGATAQVPSIYAQWKPGFAYTYLFKISDKTNGFTGIYDPTQPDNIVVNSDPAGLYPITFDAVVVDSEEDGNTQETITTVSTPSITTYQNGSGVVNNDEYTVLTPSGAVTGEIYVTVNDGNAEETPDLANGHLVTLKENGDDMVALYRVEPGTTEAFVVDALQMRDDDLYDGNIVGRNGLLLAKTIGADDALSLTNKVQYGVDGNEITLTGNQAAKFSPEASTTYAFVYFKKIKTTDTPKYQPITFSGTTFAGFSGTIYRYGYKNATAGDVQKDVLYFASETSGKKSVFLGQNVGNLMVRTGAGTTADPYNYTQASGYAVSGTTYCYGITNQVAHNVAYATFKDEVLYVVDATSGEYVAKTEESPVDGRAYYYLDPVTNKYIYCVIMPEQADNLKVLDTDTYMVKTEAAPVDGMTYFDKYILNNGVYYAKIIKVQ